MEMGKTDVDEMAAVNHLSRVAPFSLSVLKLLGNIFIECVF